MEKIIFNQFDIDTVQQLADVVKKNELSEITIVDGGKSITIKGKKFLAPQIMSVPSGIPQSHPSAAAMSANEGEQSAALVKGKAIVSPIVGTFYSSPSPDKAPFVKVGDKISEGDVVCIVESMKVMNEILAEFGGTVSEICVNNGDAVEFGQNLIIVE